MSARWQGSGARWSADLFQKFYVVPILWTDICSETAWIEIFEISVGYCFMTHIDRPVES